jgi:hypothetical protein
MRLRLNFIRVTKPADNQDEVAKRTKLLELLNRLLNIDNINRKKLEWRNQSKNQRTIKK